MSRSCHSATSSRPACRLPRRTRARPVSRSAVIGLRLWGMAELPFWPARNALLDLAHLGALQVADLGGDELDGRPDRRAGVEVLGVAVAGDHLGGGHRLQPERVAHVALDGGVDVGVRADRARSACRRPPPRGRRAGGRGRGRPAGPQGELGAEGRRLGVHAVGAADHRACRGARGPGASATPTSAPRLATSRSAASRQRPRTGRCRPRRTRSARSGSTCPPARRCGPAPRRRRRPRRGR